MTTPLPPSLGTGPAGNLPDLRGRITMDVVGFRRDAQAMANAGERSLDAIGDSADKTKRKMTGLQRGMLDVSKGIKSVQGELLALTAAGAGFSLFGLRAADNVRLLEIQFRELAGTQEKAQQLMDQIADAAQRVGIPVRLAQREFLGLIPAIEEAGGSLDEYIDLALRLSTLNPGEGIQGSIFAIREALSSGGTDLISLSERFNIPRKALRELIEETGNFGTALDIILDRYGATTVAAEAKADSLQNLGAQILDVSQRKLERAFLPVLDDVQNALKGVRDFIDGLPDEIVAMGAAGLASVAGIAAGTLALGAMLDVLNKMRTTIPGIASGLKGIASSPALQRGAVGAAAVGVGVAGGLAVSRGIGALSGDERLANIGLSDIVTTLKQGAFLIVDTFLRDVVGGLGRGFVTLVVTIKKVDDQLRLFGTRFAVVIGQIEQGIGNLLIGLADGLSGLFDTTDLRTEGQRLEGQGVTRQAEAIDTIQEIEARIEQGYQDALDAGYRGIDEAVNSALLGFANFLFPAAEEARDDVESTLRLTNPLEPIGDYVKEWADNFALQADERLAFIERLGALEAGGDPSAVLAEIDALERRRDAINQLLPTLERTADISEEAAAKAAEYNAELENISNQLPQLAAVLEATTTQALSKALVDYNKAVKEIETERDEAFDEIMDDNADALDDLRDEISRRQDKLNKDEQKALEKYHKAEEDAERKHRLRLKSINDDFRQDAELAASQLNAAGVAAAINQRKNAQDEAKEQLSESRRQNDERLQEQQQQLSEELTQIQDYYTTRRAEIDEALNEDLTAHRVKYEKELKQAEFSYSQETALLRAKLDQQLRDLDAANQAEIAMRASGHTSVLTNVQTFVNSLITEGARLINQAESYASSRRAQDAFSRSRNGASAGASRGGNQLVASNTTNRNVTVPNINIDGSRSPEEVAAAVRDAIVDLTRPTGR